MCLFAIKNLLNVSLQVRIYCHDIRQMLCYDDERYILKFVTNLKNIFLFSTCLQSGQRKHVHWN